MCVRSIVGFEEPMPLVDAPLLLFLALLGIELGLAVPRATLDDAAVLPHSIVQVLAASVGVVDFAEAHRHNAFAISILFNFLIYLFIDN